MSEKRMVENKPVRSAYSGKWSGKPMNKIRLFTIYANKGRRE